ncbi:hypothetical protein SFRURICE_004024 [Spodoptera frugiperda]|nr:hypothetical protein SFRURICE_004024 [Spodoptera frugiperda]
MTNFYYIVRLVDYFKTLDTYFLFSYGNKYFRRYINLKYRVMSLLDYKSFEKTVFTWAPLIYNALPKRITQLPFKKFCDELRKWLVSESFYSINEFFYKYPCKNYSLDLASKYRPKYISISPNK